MALQRDVCHLAFSISCQVRKVLCEGPFGVGRTFGLRATKLYAGFLFVASLFAMAGLGLLILVVLADVSHLVAPTNTPGMNP